MASSFLLSHELIYLMTWLLNNEKARLKSLIQEALENGLDKELDNMAINDQNLPSNEQLHEAFLSFLIYLENALLDVVEKNEKKKPLREQLIASIKDLNISTSTIDMQTLWVSLRQAENDLKTEQVSSTSVTSNAAKKLLLEKVIKNWKPSKKEMVH